MFSKYLYFVILIVIFLLLQGAACFFLKHVKTGMCINVTGIVEETQKWGNFTFVGFSNNCLDPTAMLSLKTMTCFAGMARRGNGYNLPMLYLLRITDPKAWNCRDNDVTQTVWGGLSIRHHFIRHKETQCLVPKTNITIKKQGVDPYIGLDDCTEAEDKRFNFGSVTCSGNAIKDANCPKDQYMVVKTASYRRLSPIKTCGLSDDYTCEVNVTSFVKKQCDGQPQCNITVNDNLFSGDQCPGSTRYLYFEYQCRNTTTFFNDICNVDGASLSHSSLPNEGFVKITTDEGIKNVCWKSLGDAKNVVCRELGYKRAFSLVEKAAPSDLKNAKFSGNIMCGNGVTKLSECLVTIFSKGCSHLSYLKCHICNRPLLEDKLQFQDSSFTASASSKGCNPSDARISSGSSWCAPFANGKHYLQVDFGKPYVIYKFVTFGDATSPKWVTTYNLNYTTDGKNWKSVQARAISGNKNAYNDAAQQTFSDRITTKALRFIPLSFKVQPCIRIEICGASQFPDKPRNLTVTDIKSRSAEISWKDPDNTGDKGLTRVWIKMKRKKSLIVNTITNKVNKYKLENLTPYTKYEVLVAAGNKHGFSEEVITSFVTFEEEVGDDRAGDDEKLKYLVGIVVVVVLLVISLVVIAYLTYENRKLKLSNKNRESKKKDRNNSKDIYKNSDKIQVDANYEQVQSEQLMYTTLKRTGKDESDNHLYAHLNEEHKDYENERETGM